MLRRNFGSVENHMPIELRISIDMEGERYEVSTHVSTENSLPKVSDPQAGCCCCWTGGCCCMLGHC